MKMLIPFYKLCFPPLFDLPLPSPFFGQSGIKAVHLGSVVLGVFLLHQRLGNDLDHILVH